MVLKHANVREFVQAMFDSVIESSPKSKMGKSKASFVFERMQISLVRFAGVDGWRSLCRRSLQLARAETPALSELSVEPGGAIGGIDQLSDSDSFILATHLLEVLVILIGEHLVMRVIGEEWPELKG